MRKPVRPTARGITAGAALQLTVVDCFSSLATYRDGRNTPLDVKEWRHQGERRAFELPESSHAGINCDEDGDEMYMMS